MTEQEIGELRRSPFALAYRMLGSVSDADDVVREGLLRVYRAGGRGERIESARASVNRGHAHGTRPASLRSRPQHGHRPRGMGIGDYPSAAAFSAVGRASLIPIICPPLGDVGRWLDPAEKTT